MMNKYLITAHKDGNTVHSQLVLAETIEDAVAEAKQQYTGLSYAAHTEQVTGQFDSYPIITPVCQLNGSKITVKVYPNGWCAQVDGDDTSMGDIPATMHSMIKAMVKSTAYDAGYYTMKVPPVQTALWDRMDWINYVTFRFDI